MWSITCFCRAKVNKYGSRVLETIESTIEDNIAIGESVKRQRESNSSPSFGTNCDDFSEDGASVKKKANTGETRKTRPSKTNSTAVRYGLVVDIDLDREELEGLSPTKTHAIEGRVSSTKSNSTKCVHSTVNKLFDIYAFKKDQL